jgi:hypothetical protein
MDSQQIPFQPEASVEMKSWYEAAKKMRIDSLATGREFSRSMISLCASGVPVYLGLLKFVLPAGYSFEFIDGLLSISPAILFLVGTVIFAVASYPQVRGLNLDDYNAITEVLTFLVLRHRRLNFIALCAFILGNIFGILVIVLKL